MSVSPAELQALDIGADPAIAALEVYHLRAGYGRVEVLHGVNLVLPRGSVLALLGPNGAGKTTLLNCASGILRPTSGCVHIAGLHVNDVAPDAFARAGVCSIPEGRGVFPNLTVNENLRVFSHAGNIPYGLVQERAFTRFPRLKDRGGQMAATLSGGERQMLSMSRAFVAEPAVMLLDEISMGLAPLIVAELYDLVGQLAADGIAILLVEQFATLALKVADYAAVMRQGRIDIVGDPDEVADHLSGAYLGEMR
ncbi:MAG: transporter related [Acidimicrobiales bacterium]|nr:transporter related [Acidimicrobiales bacterium]